MSDPNCIKAVYFGEDIYVVLDESMKKELPPGSIIYTLEECKFMAGCTELARRTAHELKKLGGAIITSSMKETK